MNGKKLLEVLGSIFVAVIFIASYAAFGSTGPTNMQPSTTSTIPPTTFGIGNTNALIYGYGQLMYIDINCNNSSVVNLTNSKITNVLSELEINNSINNYFSSNLTTFNVYTGKSDSFGVKAVVNSSLDNSSRSCTNFVGQLNIRLPQIVKFTLSGQKLSITMPPKSLNETILAKVRPIGENLPIRIGALITANGTVYGNFTITSVGG